jgi:Domain of unknown function (DUF5671)
MVGKADDIVGRMNQSEKLLEFVEAAKARGAPDDSLVQLLEKEGWPSRDIYAALGRYYENLTGLPVPARSAGAGESAREAFLYMLSFSTLATWTTALASLLFTYMNRWFPDPVTQQAVEPPDATSWNMACLIVAFPIYLLVMRSILREVEAHPEKLESGCANGLPTSLC